MFTCPPIFYPSIFVYTRPNDGWTGLYIKLWLIFFLLASNPKVPVSSLCYPPFFLKTWPVLFQLMPWSMCHSCYFCDYSRSCWLEILQLEYKYITLFLLILVFSNLLCVKSIFSEQLIIYSYSWSGADLIVFYLFCMFIVASHRLIKKT